MVNNQGGKFHRVADWLLHTMRLQKRGSHLTCKVANKCLNVRERVEVVDRNKDAALPSPAVL